MTQKFNIPNMLAHADATAEMSDDLFLEQATKIVRDYISRLTDPIEIAETQILEQQLIRHFYGLLKFLNEEIGTMLSAPR
jgi:hypothetical protein